MSYEPTTRTQGVNSESGLDHPGGARDSSRFNLRKPAVRGGAFSAEAESVPRAPSRFQSRTSRGLHCLGGRVGVVFLLPALAEFEEGLFAEVFLGEGEDEALLLVKMFPGEQDGGGQGLFGLVQVVGCLDAGEVLFDFLVFVVKRFTVTELIDAMFSGSNRRVCSTWPWASIMEVSMSRMAWTSARDPVAGSAVSRWSKRLWKTTCSA